MQTPREFVNANRDNMIKDIERLVNINSIKSAPAPHAPYGMGVRRTELEAMKIASELGFEKVKDCDGYIAYAHVGPEDKFLGIIGHADVVPVGDGWDSDPFVMQRRDGYLVGRGTDDDKGPLVAAMYAARYLIENNIPLNYGIRVLIGCDEECGMSDLDYYLANYPEPVFTFTPDAGFPVCHGEKGIYGADLVSPVIENGKIVSMFGGLASNMVPDNCTVTLKGVDVDALTAAANSKDYATLSVNGDEVTLTTVGKAAHAGGPWEAINANLRALSLLVEAGVLEGDELAAVNFMCSVMSDMSGEFLGIAGEDGRFDKTSIIGGMVRRTDCGRLLLNVNSRYNTSVSPEDIEKNIAAKAAEFGFEAKNVSNSGPVYLEPDMPAVKMMVDIYNEVTGDNAKPYVMSGGTYARKMNNAVAFGIGMFGEKAPDWVGSAHAKNEALCVDTLMKAAEIYIHTLLKLQEVEF